MKLTLIGKGKIYTTVLPQNPIGTYWITDGDEQDERKILRIDGDAKNWYISTKKNTSDKIKIELYGVYTLNIGNRSDTMILFCTPIYEESMLHLEIKSNNEISLSNDVEISIGKDNSNDIIYDNEYVSNVHAKIIKKDGRYTIENYDQNFGTFVNNSPVFKSNRVLLNGDFIFIMGLKLILMGDTIIINTPLNNVKYNKSTFDIIEKEANIPEIEENQNEEENIELFEKKEYYSRAPRIVNKIEREKIKIDAPPTMEKKDQLPLFLMLGSTLSFGAIMILSTINSLIGALNGNFTGETLIQILTAVLMLVGILLIPIIQRRYEKKQKEKYEIKRQKKYKEYINSKISEIDSIIERQRKILHENFPSVEECLNIVLSKSQRLWERKIEDSDFLTLNLGNGNIPSNIDIQYPEKQFSLEDDNLVEILNTVANKSKVLEDVPITLSLAENNIVGLISKDDEEAKRFLKNIILQLVTFQSYEDLKLVFLLKKDINKRWEHLNLLPHVWNNLKNMRFFTDEYEEMQEISKAIEEELQNRLYLGKDIDYKNFKTYYLIITDDYKKIENLKIITEILKIKYNIGFGIICMADNLMGLPDECKTFIEINNGSGTVLSSEMSLSSKKSFTFNTNLKIFWERISTTLSNIPIKYNSSKEMMLPSMYTFLEMYDAGTIEQLNVLARWNKNDSTRSLKAQIRN